MRETERRERGRHRLSQEDKGTVRRRDGAAGQVCLRERIPGTPQPAGVRPGYKRAAGFLHPLRCYYPRKESEGKMMVEYLTLTQPLLEQHGLYQLFKTK